MPRQARLDAPGLLHHVMARGLNRQKIFQDRWDYEDFLKRLSAALEKSPCEILAWALMPNHSHFLIRSGAGGLCPLMRRLLTGYAQAFNRRHHRVGYLFQGRYKSLVCEEEEYLLTLVRYIHLNPIAGGVLRSMKELESYPYTGHSALMGKRVYPWQALDEVLGRFGKQAGLARRHYETFLADGLPEVRGLAVDLLGGGLLEVLQEEARRARREEDQALRDSRVLGESDFVERVWKEAEEKDAKVRAFKRKGIDLRALAKRVSQKLHVHESQLFERGRQAPVSAAKALLIYAAVEYLGKTTLELARLTRMSLPAASKARWRGSQLARKISGWETLVN
jgi:REP element-mobilizing transposase RayT